MSKYMSRHLPKDLGMLVNEYLIPSQDDMRLRFKDVMQRIRVFVDDSRPLDVIFISSNLVSMSLWVERQYGYYSECHYLG